MNATVEEKMHKWGALCSRGDASIPERLKQELMRDLYECYTSGRVEVLTDRIKVAEESLNRMEEK